MWNFFLCSHDCVPDLHVDLHVEPWIHNLYCVVLLKYFFLSIGNWNVDFLSEAHELQQALRSSFQGKEQKRSLLSLHHVSDGLTSGWRSCYRCSSSVWDFDWPRSPTRILQHSPMWSTRPPPAEHFCIHGETLLPEQPALPPPERPVIPSGRLIHLLCASVTQPDKWGVDCSPRHTAQSVMLVPENPTAQWCDCSLRILKVMPVWHRFGLAKITTLYYL